MTPAEAEVWVAVQLGWKGKATPIRGGLLNFVFRVVAEPPGDKRVIVKHAPPYVATAPDIALDPGRARFESAALMAARGRPARNLRSPILRATEGATLAMEDLGDLPSLDQWLLDGGDLGVLTKLGIGIKALHGRGDPPRMHNLPIQKVRLEIQYRRVGPLLADAGVVDAATLGERAERLGDRFLDRGDSWIHGDLWPASVLISDQGPCLLDWEMSTMGHRAQDVGHLVAHLWMLDHRRAVGTEPAQRFLRAYGQLSDVDRAETAVQFGCEIIMRVLGSFQRDYLYDDVPADGPVAAEAIAVAAAAIRDQLLPESLRG